MRLWWNGLHTSLKTKRLKGMQVQILSDAPCIFMKRSYRPYTDADIIENAAKVKSLSQLLSALGLRNAGGNFDNMKRNLQRLDVDTSHWTGQGWNKDQQLKNWNEYTRGSQVKPHLIKLRGHACENCKSEIWIDRPIKLELHHIDGNRANNNLSNLQLLCPNCHSYTDSWKRQK
jgi:5-methylcytosine-specific restriction endonuclease McrA